MAMRIVPAAAHPTSTTNTTVHSRSHADQSTGPSSQPLGAPSAPGLHDTLRAAQGTLTSTHPHLDLPTPTSSHPLETRLLHWRATQYAMRMEALRRTHGIAEPVRRGMELDIVRNGEYRPAVLGGSAGVSGDILEGRDTEIDWEDVYGGRGNHDGLHKGTAKEGLDFHSELEQKLKMN